MGAIKLRENARKGYSVSMTAEQAERFKTGWRQRNRRIVTFWGEMEATARAAILRQGTVQAVGGSGIAFTCTARTLQMRLPSGRVLYYHNRSSTGTPATSSTGAPRSAGAGWSSGHGAANWRRTPPKRRRATSWRRRCCGRGGGSGAVPCMTVHDELVYALARDRARLGTIWNELMLEAPPWAGGLPLGG